MTGHPGILLTFEETELALKNYAAGFGWDLAELESKGLLAVVSARIQPDAVLSGDFDLRGVIGILRQKAASMKAEQVVVDAPDAFLRLLGDLSKERAELHLLHEWLREAEMTALMTVKSRTDQTLSSHYDFLDYMADCVIHLDQRVLEQVTTRRLRVQKYRGSACGRNEYPFGITDQGIWIIPVTQASLRHASLGESLSSGVDRLDIILGGGYRRNACTLLTGNSGTGKTTFACAFALSMVSVGERILYLDFEESWDALVSCMLSPGLDMRLAMDSGKLKFLSNMPESQGIEEHLIQAFRAIEDFNPQHLIIDAISACRRMGSDHAAFDYLIRIIDHCKQRGITTLLTNLISVMGPDREITGIDLSSVIDTVIVLRNVEKQGRFIRDLGVLKSRGRAHSSRLHEFRITDNGIEIIETEGGNVK
jgi:circadian clock protein KaiC